MRIIFVTKSFPWPLHSGADIRNYFLIKHLSKSHLITLVSISRSPVGSEQIMALQPFCEQIEYFVLPRTFRKKITDFCKSFFFRLPYTVLANTDSEIMKTLRRLVKTGEYDLIQFQELYVAANLDNQISVIPHTIDLHNIEKLILSRLANTQSNLFTKCFYLIQSKFMNRFEISAARNAKAVFTVSKSELSHFRNLGANAYLVPNGIENTIPPAEKRRHTILFTGTLRYPPNQDALVFFFKSMWPALSTKFPELSFEIVGQNPAAKLQAHQSSKVNFLSDIPDITPIMQSARVLVVPLRIGGGTRLKILQAFAYGLPVVSTSIGAEGLAVADGVHLLIRDQPESFIEAIELILNNQELSDKLATAAQQLVIEKYLWSNLVQTCNNAYASGSPHIKPIAKIQAI